MIKTLLTIFFICFSSLVLSKPSSILIDAKTGNEIVSHNADFVRYPASLTKVLTLFIVFDYLKAGKLSLDELITITPNAVRDMPNFKLYRVPGATITVDQAIRATAIKSANDTAVALGEHIAGSEQAFVAMMNRKAVELGMENSHFHHPAGLPSPKQTSTARDLAKLARSILMTHPEYAYFFSVPYFYFHNRKYKKAKFIDFDFFIVWSIINDCS